MNELGFDIQEARPWFTRRQFPGHLLVTVSEQAAATWAEVLGIPVRRCYISDGALGERSALLGISSTEVIGAVLPDAGSTMSGDFGEILVLFYNCATELVTAPVNAKKWRLKQDRTKPAPHSDVLNFILPAWPAASEEDVVICSEVKAKATDGDSTPVASAIADCAKDRTSRLGRTLEWLKERAIGEDLGALTIAHLERFIKAVEFPPATKRFQAVAVVCSNLLQVELAAAPAVPHPDYTVIVISVPELKEKYSAVFASAAASGDEG